MRVCGSLLLSGSADLALRVWLIREDEKGECVAILNGHTTDVNGVVLAPGGGKIGSISGCGGNGEFIIWVAEGS